MGVWKKVGPSTYKLNHMGFNYDGNGALIAVAVIREKVVVDKTGNAYTASISVDLFDPQGNHFSHVQGQIQAVRITAD
jgi:hypothetical protein